MLHTISKSNINKIILYLEKKSNELPVISIGNDNDIRVGKYYCKHFNNYWNVYHNNDLCYKFVMKKSALAWCVAKMQSQICDANSIQEIDDEYDKYSNDSYLFYHRIRASNNKTIKDILYMRYNDSEFKRNIIKSKLEEFVKKIKIK